MCDACRVRTGQGFTRDRERGASAVASPPLPSAPALLLDDRLARSSMGAVRAGVARRAQHELGNRGTRRVLARNGTTAEAQLPAVVEHKSGAWVDAALLASAFFGPYIKPKYEKGIKAHGQVHRHAQAAWDVEIAKYLKGKQNPDTGNVFTDDEAREFGKRVNAFADGRQIHVNERRGEPATTVHESMHLFSADTWLPAVGFNVNEGATEYFTKKLCAEHKLTRGNFYEKQHRSVKKLAGAVGEKVLADAFFNGDLARIKKKVDGARNFLDRARQALGDKAIAKRAGTWDAWVGKMKAGKYDEADALL